MILRLLLLIWLHKAFNLENKKESSYDVRPNLFIDKNHLLGRPPQPASTCDLSLETVNRPHFAYDHSNIGPAHWSKTWSECGEGKKQSPVNIEIAALKHICLPPLTWSTAFDEVPYKMTLKNIGTTVELKVYYDGCVPTISGGPLKNKTYVLDNIRFHWSTSDHHGSEHTINKKTYPLEMQMMSRRQDFNITQAIKKSNGLLIIGYIFEIDLKCNEAMENIIAVLDHVKHEAEEEEDLINSFRLNSLLDTISKEYVAYNGSLTTPPCYESAIWIISPYTIGISKKQLEKFRSLYGSNKAMENNYRPIQSKNNRDIYFIK